MVPTHTEDADRWLVIYDDGSTCDEDDGGRRRGWAEVNAEQVAMIQLHADNQIVASVAIPVGAEPVFFRRRTIALDINGDEPQETGYTSITIIGWRWPDGTACWLWRGVDGGVVMTAGDVQE